MRKIALAAAAAMLALQALTLGSCASRDVTAPPAAPPAAPPPAASGSLRISMSLPGTALGWVTIRGPSDYAVVVTSDTTLSALHGGSYTVVASNIQYQYGYYAATPESTTVVVGSSSTPATVSVAYALISGQLTLDVSGVPTGFPIAIRLVGPAGYDQTWYGNAPQLGPLTLLAGDYTVIPQVAARGDTTYGPTIATQLAHVPVSSSPVTVAVAYVTPAALAIVTASLPNGRADTSYGGFVTTTWECYQSLDPHLGGCQPCPSAAACASLPTGCGRDNAHQCWYRVDRTAFRGITLTGSGGVPPYTWAAAGLPAGLSVDSLSGHVLGTPTAAGSYPVTVTLRDSASPRQEVTANYVLLVSP